MDSDPMDTAGIIISPSIHQKIKARNAAMRLKHGVPQFKDVLRKRFKNRIKENRGRLFDRLRHVDVSQTANVNKFIQEELLRILSSESLSVMDDEEEARIREEITSEALLDQENWLMQHFDLLMTDDDALQQLWEDTQQVVCPVCRRGNLSCNGFSQMIHCDHCSTSVPARASLQNIQDRIHMIINNHDETGCHRDTLFFVSQEDASLYAHCDSCPFFDLAV